MIARRVLAAACAATALVAAAPADAAYFGFDGKLVFQSLTGDGIYTANPNGSGVTKIFDEPSIPGPAVRALPTWSPDGERIAFASRISGTTQIHTMNADGSGVQQVTSTATGENSAPAWRSDGAKIAYVASQPAGIRTVNPDGTGSLAIGPAGVQPTELAWGYTLAYTADNGGQFDIFTINSTTGPGPAVNLTANNPLTDDTSPEWKATRDPPVASLAFRTFRDSGAGIESAIWSMSPNGAGQTPLITGEDAAFPAYAPDEGIWIVYSTGAGELKIAYGDGELGASLGISGLTPDWQPLPRDVTPPLRPQNLIATPGDEQVRLDWAHPEEGDVTFEVVRCIEPCSQFTRLAEVIESEYIDAPIRNGVVVYYRVWATDESNNEGSHSQTPRVSPQPAPYVRPKSASPLHVSLVPAFEPCVSPNRAHGPPLAHPSCAPPVPGSSQLTAGTGDGDQAAARSTGFVKLNVVGVAGEPDDSDVRVQLSLTNVMNAGDLSEYDGELRGLLRLRITDRLNPSAASGGTTGSATVLDIELGYTVPCLPTAATSLASTCSITTSADALAPGAVPEAGRAMWQVEQVQVLDGGPDGDGDTAADNRPFAVQGVFVP